jgi:restriction system protein
MLFLGILIILFSLIAPAMIQFAKTPKFKGIMGEWKLSMALRSLDNNQYQIINNVTLPTEDGTTQIDHIVVSIFGIFVLETKNMQGWIFGSSSQKKWNQQIYKQSFKFQNPIHQNYKHIKTLEAILELKPNQLHSIVVFVGECEFKTEMPENVRLGTSSALHFIKSKDEIVLTKLRMEVISKRINNRRLERSFKTDREHIENLNKRFHKDPDVVSVDELCESN